MESAERSPQGDVAQPPPPATQATSERRFFAAVLWLCAGAAVYLLFGSAAFNVRAMTGLVDKFEDEAREAGIRNVSLEGWRDSLAGDPSVIEREARKLGYGRTGETVYPISAAEYKAARKRWAADGARGAPPAASALSQALLPALTLLILGAIAVLFFSDLRVDDPNRPGDRERASP